MRDLRLEAFLGPIDREIYSILNKIDSYQDDLDAPDEGLDRLADALENAQDVITNIVYLRNGEVSNAAQME